MYGIFITREINITGVNIFLSDNNESQTSYKEKSQQKKY